jgi:LysR family transcriptional regulator, transcription activator of glutamate synthase operon
MTPAHVTPPHVTQPHVTQPHVSADDLRAFLAVAEAEHVTAAAARLHLSQPAVTRAIGRLEDQFRVRLFDRPGHRVRLNGFGRALAGHAVKIIAQLDGASTDIAGLLDPHAGPVRIGFVRSLGTWLVPDLIRSFKAVEPGVEFQLHQGLSEQVVDQLLRGDVDLILTSPRPRRPEQVSWELLADERLELAVPPGHRLAGRRRIRLAEVAAEPFVALAVSSEFRELSDRLCGEAGFSPAVAFEADDVATVRALVGAGLGIAILPALHQPTASGAPATLAIAAQHATRPIGLAWIAGRQLPAIAEAFRGWLISSAPWAGDPCS